MTDEPTDLSADNRSPEGDEGVDETILHYYKIRFRSEGQEFTASSHLADLVRGDEVIVGTEQGPEPAKIICRSAGAVDTDIKRPVTHRIQRRISEEEAEKYHLLPQQEKDAYSICRHHVERLSLPMHLVRVERFFNGSKMIFYFTAESRVDFRELVKALVQEFRTRVEMRQIGVRHETQMTGGIGACGRELCCTAFLTRFNSVSIKMAKAQDLPLNPAKISGLCNRLLCCLTYEYDSYRNVKKGMPRVGRTIVFEGKSYQVIRQIPLMGQLVTQSEDGEERVFEEEEWRVADPLPKPPSRKVPGKKGANKTASGETNPPSESWSKKETKH